MTVHSWCRAALLAALCGAAACGGGNGGGGGTPTGPSGAGPGPSGAVFTIGSNGSITPTAVSISVGQSVTFVNNNSRGHEVASDPHPTHTMCPSINALGTVAAGQTKLTNAFTAAGSCSFHDHTEPDNANLKGTITIR